MKSTRIAKLALLLWSSCSVAWAGPAPKIVFLSSVPEPAEKPWLAPDDWTLKQELEDRFRESLEGSGYDAQVIHDADQFQLHETLVDPSNIAVIWLSHAAAGQGGGVTGLSEDGMILDERGIDVKEVFQQTHPGLIYLGVVGCGAVDIFKGFSESGFFSKTIEIFSFAQPVEPLEGLRDALCEGKTRLEGHDFENDDSLRYSLRHLDPHLLSVFENASRSAPVSPSGLSITVSRVIPHEAGGLPNAARIEIDGQMLGIFPNGSPGEKQSLALSVPDALIKRSRDGILRFLFASGASRLHSSMVVPIGELSIDAPSSLRQKWSKFTDGLPESKVYHLRF